MVQTATSALDKDLAEVRRIVLSGVGDRARVYLYGSRARGAGSRTSDIDVGVVPVAPLDPAMLADIREALEQSNVLWSVDLVDLSRTDPTFRDHALAGAIEWTG